MTNTPSHWNEPEWIVKARQAAARTRPQDRGVNPQHTRLLPGQLRNNEAVTRGIEA